MFFFFAEDEKSKNEVITTKKNEREKPSQPEVLLNITTSRGF